MVEGIGQNMSPKHYCENFFWKKLLRVCLKTFDRTFDNWQHLSWWFWGVGKGMSGTKFCQKNYFVQKSLQLTAFEKIIEVFRRGWSVRRICKMGEQNFRNSKIEENLEPYMQHIASKKRLWIMYLQGDFSWYAFHVFLFHGMPWF